MTPSIEMEVGGCSSYAHPSRGFGGKSRAASLVWEALGDVASYVEPFAGSLAVLLARPHTPTFETVNDIDCFLANFWRAVKASPSDVAEWCDYPISEADLHARHRWLWDGRVALREMIETDPDAFDAKVAGWWCWGLSQWIGGGWCSGALHRRKPRAFGHFQGNGVHADGFGGAEQIAALAGRLRRVRIYCGGWERAVTHGTLLGDRQSGSVAGLFLDPPYAHSAGRDPGCYGEHDHKDVAADVRAWCALNGSNPRLRIVLAGYDVEHVDLDACGWRVVEWEASGFRLSESSRANQRRERLWLSPHCVGARQPGLFDAAGAR